MVDIDADFWRQKNALAREGRDGASQAVAGDQDHGELAIGEPASATATIVVQVIAAAGAEATYPTGRNSAKNYAKPRR
jgi:hypothetical protein